MNRDEICYYDYYISTFYIFDANNLSDSKKYALHSSNILTEDKVRNADVSSTEFDHLESYVYEDGAFWGRFKYGESCYDFKLDVQTDSCLLNHHIDLGYVFLCSYDGWYYLAFEPTQLLQITTPQKYRPSAIQELLEDALKPYKNEIRETDNYYILRMRKKKDK